MAETTNLNCTGMKCPRPIIEVAKLARKNEPGTLLTIQADDLAFESDLRAWCETTGATRAGARGVVVGGFEPLATYVEQFLALGGEILVCAPCTSYYCALDEGSMVSGLLEGAKICGLATVVGRIREGTKDITF